MSTAGSTRSGQPSAYTLLTPPTGSWKQEPTFSGVFRWRGIIPIVLVAALLIVGWMLFGERMIRGTLSEAATKALGAQVDIADLEIGLFAPSVELKGVALADPFDLTKNKFEIARLVLELDAAPLLEKKVVVKRLTVADVRTGTRRTAPARPVPAGGFAPSALAEVKRFSDQFRVPGLALAPLDSLKALILDPSQLRAVRAAALLRPKPIQRKRRWSRATRVSDCRRRSTRRRHSSRVFKART